MGKEKEYNTTRLGMKKSIMSSRSFYCSSKDFFSLNLALCVVVARDKMNSIVYLKLAIVLMLEIMLILV